MKKGIIFLFLAMFLLLGGQHVQAQDQNGDKIQVLIFHLDTCPHCKRIISYIEGLKVTYPNLDIYKYEASSNQSYIDFLQALTKVYKNDTSGVPIIYIGGQVIIGEDRTGVDNAIKQCVTEKCQNPSDKVDAKYFEQANKSSEPNNSNSKNSQNNTGFVILVITGVAVVAYLAYIAYKNKKNKT